jgi:uncharacterized Ntn-hydrolase superfamily protein
VLRGTYSIVARDEASGALGVAVESHWFSVGSIVSWAEPGAGAVATQSLAEASYGPRTLDLLRSGAAPADALEQLTAQDEAAAVRQLGVVDSHGVAAAHTGSECIRNAGHRTGPGFSCQANLMLRDTVPDAMAAAFEASAGVPLAERLLATLDAAEAEGGDIRGRQSAVLVVVPADGEPWRRLVDLRVDDHPAPLPELRRLYSLKLAYDLSERAEDLTAEGRHDEAAPLYEQAAEHAPDSDELLFWAGLGAAQAGHIELGVERIRSAAELNPRWLELLERLEPTVAPAAAAVRDALSNRGG